MELLLPNWLQNPRFIADTFPLANSIPVGYTLGMLLEEYLETNSISVEKFARQIRAGNRTVVYRYLGENRRIPRADMMEKIVKVTNGLVTPNDFYGAKTHNVAPANRNRNASQ